jgi:predicted thioesterase
MAVSDLRVGLVGELEHEVTEARTAQHIGSGSLRVFATPAMVALIEQACVNLVKPFLPEGQTTVGVAMTIRHLAPTLLGKAVRTRVELVAVDGRSLTFRAQVSDEAGVVGEAEHGRAVIDVERFLKRVRERADG